MDPRFEFPIDLKDYGKTNSYYPSITALKNGGFAIASTSLSPSSDNQDGTYAFYDDYVAIQIYNGSTGLFNTFETDDVECWYPSIASLGNENSVVAYNKPEDHVAFRILNNLSEEIAPETQIEKELTNDGGTFGSTHTDWIS